MPHSRFSGDEIADRGEAIYAESLRAHVEIPENIGKIISIDIETGDYELADDLLSGAMRLQAKHPDAAIYGKRIGYNAVVAVGGTLTRVVP
jgi:N12 class adenine-specific DNA methylase